MDFRYCLRNKITGYSYTDEETRETILQVFEKFGYMICPHTSIGYRAAREYQGKNEKRIPIVTLATAHPVKFRDVIEPEIHQTIEVPERLNVWLEKEKKSISVSSRFDEFKQLLQQNF